MASSSTAFYLKNSGFHVRNVPKEWNDWNLFHVFEQFGRVGYCRVAVQSQQDNAVQLGFVNMLSVCDADEVRKALSDGSLIGEGYSLKVLDQKTHSHQFNAPAALSPISKLLGTAPAKKQPVLLSSSWLPLNKDIEVEVVDYLPSSSVSDDLFALTLLRINDSGIQEKYQQMFDKMNSYAQLVPFDTELEIGYDGLYREASKSVHRVRRISVNKMYLVDVGKIINYDKKNIFQLPKVFQSVPTRVSLCGIDGLKWYAAAIPSFDKIRDVVQQWGQLENTTLHTTTVGFSGSINMINLYCGDSVLAERLHRKGACEYTPRDQQPRYAYSRDLLLQHNNHRTVNLSIPRNFADFFADFIVGPPKWSNALR
uniref:RRM domain-containing protein n=1 Tax=Caenorhabditis japonica TaxID=281687 RepID=A0A8R1DXV5_CAEJA